eukprot:6491500-Amphidinium_carterae.1
MMKGALACAGLPSWSSLARSALYRERRGGGHGHSPLATWRGGTHGLKVLVVERHPHIFVVVVVVALHALTIAISMEGAWASTSDVPMSRSSVQMNTDAKHHGFGGIVTNATCSSDASAQGGSLQASGSGWEVGSSDPHPSRGGESGWGSQSRGQEGTIGGFHGTSKLSKALAHTHQGGQSQKIANYLHMGGGGERSLNLMYGSHIAILGRVYLTENEPTRNTCGAKGHRNMVW